MWVTSSQTWHATLRTSHAIAREDVPAPHTSPCTASNRPKAHAQEHRGHKPDRSERNTEDHTIPHQAEPDRSRRDDAHSPPIVRPSRYVPVETGIDPSMSDERWWPRRVWRHCVGGTLVHGHPCAKGPAASILDQDARLARGRCTVQNGGSRTSRVGGSFNAMIVMSRVALGVSEAILNQSPLGEMLNVNRRPAPVGLCVQADSMAMAVVMTAPTTRHTRWKTGDLITQCTPAHIPGTRCQRLDTDSEHNGRVAVASDGSSRRCRARSPTQRSRRGWC